MLAVNFQLLVFCDQVIHLLVRQVDRLYQSPALALRAGILARSPNFARALLTIADNVQIVRDLLVVDNWSQILLHHNGFLRWVAQALQILDFLVILVGGLL